MGTRKFQKNKSIGAIVAWGIYDWASSAFPVLVTTFVFATYFTESVAKNRLVGTEQWGDAIALAGIMIAILGPIFGAIADRQGRRKPWLFFFTLLMVVSTASLWFMTPTQQHVIPMLVLVVLGTLGLEIGMVFYNAMLQNLAPKDYIGRISGWGWGLGYAGGLTCLILTLILFIQPETRLFYLNTHTAEQIRIAGPFIAIWILLFSWPVFVFTPDRPSTHVRAVTAIKEALQTLRKTLRALPKRRSILLFLIAHMLYIDGLNTLFAFGGIYAAGTFHLSFVDVLKFGIAMNVAAGLGAAAFAWVDDFLGAKKTILISLFCLILAGVGILLVRSQLWFWILALILGLFVGPVQAASRSLMVRISPPKIVTELFGLYALSGKATAFINPWLVGLLTVTFHSQRVGMSSVFVFLFIGGVLLFKVAAE